MLFIMRFLVALLMARIPPSIAVVAADRAGAAQRQALGEGLAARARMALRRRQTMGLLANSG
jgi:hypothetical protein